MISDVNDDGVPDVLVSGVERTKRKGVNGTRTMRKGVAYLFSGADGRSLQTFRHPGGKGHFGHTVMELGDVNVDDTVDVAIFSPNRKAMDVLFLLSGPHERWIGGHDGHLIRRITLPADQHPRDYTGRAIAHAGDVNGDEITDVFLGMPGADLNDPSDAPPKTSRAAQYPSAGRAVLYSGAVERDRQRGKVLRQFRAPVPDDNGYFGSAVATLSTGGQITSVVVGAVQEERSGLFSGADDAGLVYLFNLD